MSDFRLAVLVASAAVLLPRFMQTTALVSAKKCALQCLDKPEPTDNLLKQMCPAQF